MNITADTNVLVRSAVRDNAEQADAADRLLRSAATIAIPLPCLCEFVWVLSRLYGISRKDVATAVRALAAAETVRTNRPAVELGLKLFEAGGDFADGVIAFEGQCLGGETFVSFDRQAVKLLQASGYTTRTLK